MNREDITECHYHLGMNYRDILLFIGLMHGQLKRILRSCGLGRRINRSDSQDVCRCIEEELRGNGSAIYLSVCLSVCLSIYLSIQTVVVVLVVVQPWNSGMSQVNSAQMQRDELNIQLNAGRSFC